MPIDIENPGAADAALKAALRELIFSGARISAPSAFTPTTGSETDLTTPMTTEEFDVGGYADLGTSPGRLTVTEAGYYMAFFQCRRSTSVADQFLAFIRQYNSGGSLIRQYYGGDVESAGGDSAQCSTGPVAASAGDYFVGRYFVTTGGDMDGSGHSWLSLVRLG